MRFSILLPTRDRLDYLRLAVESVLRQDFEDWQLVISDNCSAEDIGAYATSLGDPRIVYRRTERPVAVTENWNRALAFSEGEYVIMLGDDDALLGGYLRRMDDLIREFEEPEVIYTKALLFTYPGVDPARPAGFLVDHGCAEFYGAGSAPFVLEHERAVALVDVGRLHEAVAAMVDREAVFARHAPLERARRAQPADVDVRPRRRRRACRWR